MCAGPAAVMAPDLQTITIDWGDGSPNYVIHNWLPGDEFVASHSFPDPEQLYKVRIKATDDDGGYAKKMLPTQPLEIPEITDLKVAYLGDEDQWIGIPDGDPLWDGDILKWTVEYAPENFPDVGWIEVMAMPWSQWEAQGSQYNQSNPLLGWTTFAEGAPGDLLLGDPGGPGLWAITAKLELSNPLVPFVLMQAPEQALELRVDSVEWVGVEVDGDTNLREDGQGYRFYPEKNRHDGAANTVHTKVKFKANIVPNLPQAQGKRIQTRLYDPDDPSAFVDPIDDDSAGGMKGLTDNRGSASFPVTMTIDGSQGDYAIAQAEFTTSKAIGDNHRIVASGRITGFGLIQAKYSATDPETLGRLKVRTTGETLFAGANAVGNNNNVQISPLLTVWRTLYVEADKMPDPSAQWPADDDILMAMPEIDDSAFADAMSPMFIEARPFPGLYNARRPSDDPANFRREFVSQAAMDDYFVGVNGFRDSKVESDDYWTVYIASIYELGTFLMFTPTWSSGATDNDANDEFGMMGWTSSANPEYSVVMQEVVRDVVAEHAADWAGTPDAADKIQQIVALHEVGHQLLGYGQDVHAGDFPSDVMALPTFPPTNDDERRIVEMQLLFRDSRIDQIRDDYADGDHP